MLADAYVMAKLEDTRMQLSRLVDCGRIDEATARVNMEDAEKMAANGIILDLRIA